MQWTLQAMTWNNATTKRELRAARNRKLSLKLRAPSTLGFSMMGAHPQSSLITELVTDVMVSCKQEVNDLGLPLVASTDVLRARCGTSQDTGEETGNGVTFGFVDYRGVLMRRYLKSDNKISWSNADQSDIAWEMLEPTNGIQKRTNGNYGITRGVGTTTGIKRDRNPKLGSYVGKEIDSMAQSANGYEWDVSPAMAFNLYYPTRGANNGVGLEYGKSVSAFTRTRTATGFANDDLVTGANTLTPINIMSATVQTDPMGRWDGVVAHPDVSEVDTLTSKATFDIAATSSLLPQYTVRLAPGFWRGPSHIGLGDTVRLRVAYGRINDNALFRVLEINLDLLDEGGEDVRMVLGA